MEHQQHAFIHCLVYMVQCSRSVSISSTKSSLHHQLTPRTIKEIEINAQSNCFGRESAALHLQHPWQLLSVDEPVIGQLGHCGRIYSDWYRHCDMDAAVSVSFCFVKLYAKEGGRLDPQQCGWSISPTIYHAYSKAREGGGKLKRKRGFKCKGKTSNIYVHFWKIQNYTVRQKDTTSVKFQPSSFNNVKAADFARLSPVLYRWNKSFWSRFSKIRWF